MLPPAPVQDTVYFLTPPTVGVIVVEFPVSNDPDKPSDPVQDVAYADVQVRTTGVPTVAFGDAKESVIVGAGVTGTESPPPPPQPVIRIAEEILTANRFNL